MIIQNLFRDYARHSTIHGVSYIAERGRSRCKRVWWIAVVCLSALCCGKLALDAWNISPIITSFKAKQTPIWQIPFPAVTVCPNSLARMKLVDYFRDEHHGEKDFPNLNATEKLLTTAKAAFCYKQMLFNSIDGADCNQCLARLRSMKIPQDELFFDCKFGNRAMDCGTAFKEVIIDYKLCYTFNGLDLLRHNTTQKTDWNVDGGYNSTTNTLDAYPLRSIGAGPNFGLSFLFRDDDKHLDRFCSVFPGFLLEFRMPYESPRFETSHFYVRMDDSLMISVTPSIFSMSEEVQNYPLEKRKCYFSNERPLKYYSLYTQSNCVLDCITTTMVERCGCLPANIEFQFDQNPADICGPNHGDCVSSAKDYLFQQNYEQCHCLPACSSITYETEQSVANFNESMLKNAVNGPDGYKYTKVSIFFKENHFMTLQRSEHYRTTDFLANCGGIMGLCLGISVISLLEIVYFCVVRLCCCHSVYTTKDSDGPGTDSTHGSFQSVQTTINGIKFTVDTNLDWIERMWWTIVVGLSIICCGSLISDVYDQYANSPVIISYENEERYVGQIPFPAVTICPQVVMRYTPSFFNHLKVQNSSLYEFTDKSIQSITAAAQACDTGIFSDVDPENKTDCEFCAGTLKTWMGKTNNIIFQSSHLYTEEYPDQMFEKVVTPDGACFTYNGIGIYRFYDTPDEWSLEDGYKNKTSPLDSQPRRGSRIPLQFTLAIATNRIDGMCKVAAQRVKIYFHMPHEAPLMSKHYIFAAYKHHTQILLNPRMTVPAPDLRALAIAQRQCYFTDERSLRFYRHYTENNCKNECVVNATLTECGCLMFYMPMITGVKYCGISEQHCYHQQHARDCHCLPTCTTIAYDTEVNQVYMNDEWIRRIISSGLEKEFSLIKLTIVFRENQFIALKRSQLFGKTEFLANCGGLLGLFLGFSVISVMELFYLCAIRVFSACLQRF